MSLIKLDSKGRIRESWLYKKSTKRLKVILSKSRKNYSDLHEIMKTLHSHNIPINEIGIVYHRHLLNSATLDNIIYRRELNKS
ncbi:MAG TPA: hypothetical protein VLA48_02525 [Nitrososphaeraceae archaeon]|nr:hypothetical protein [Nitrososphaeraceae archaeon]